MEAVISDYTADGIMQNGGVFYNNETVYPNTGYEQILNKVIMYNGMAFKIVGIFGTDYKEVTKNSDFRSKFNLENIYQTAICKGGALAGLMTSHNLPTTDLAVANVFIELPNDAKKQKQMLSYLYDNNYEVLTYATNELKTMQTLFDLTANILNIICVILAVFVLIFLYNFIAGSINNKTKEIGILRSLGARGVDIAKVFGFEGAIIAVTNIILSLAAIVIAVPIFNSVITEKFPTHITVISVTPLSVLASATLCIVITAVSCIIPLVRLTKMRPTEVIRRAE